MFLPLLSSFICIRHRKTLSLFLELQHTVNVPNNLHSSHRIQDSPGFEEENSPLQYKQGLSSLSSKGLSWTVSSECNCDLLHTCLLHFSTPVHSFLWHISLISVRRDCRLIQQIHDYVLSVFFFLRIWDRHRNCRNHLDLHIYTPPPPPFCVTIDWQCTSIISWSVLSMLVFSHFSASESAEGENGTSLRALELECLSSFRLRIG